MIRSIARISSVSRHLTASITSMASSNNGNSSASADPYTEQASEQTSLNVKIAELHEIIDGAKQAMLTARIAGSNHFHSRAMIPASKTGLVFEFLANLESGKFKDIEGDKNVSITYSDGSNTHWASIAGEAKIVTQHDNSELIKKLWTPDIKAWLGDLGDGKRDGSASDPRVAVIQVVPIDIRYWYRTRSSVGQAFEVVKGAVTGDVATPGVLRTINAKELESVRTLDGKQV